MYFCKKFGTLARPKQSCMFPYRSIDFKKVLLIVQYKYSKSCSRDLILQNLILCTRSCGTGFITQSSWVFHFHETMLVGWKCFVPQLYQLWRGISGGPALQHFYMIQRGGRPCHVSHFSKSSTKVKRGHDSALTVLSSRYHRSRQNFLQLIHHTSMSEIAEFHGAHISIQCEWWLRLVLRVLAHSINNGY